MRMKCEYEKNINIIVVIKAPNFAYYSLPIAIMYLMLLKFCALLLVESYFAIDFRRTSLQRKFLTPTLI